MLLCFTCDHYLDLINVNLTRRENDSLKKCRKSVLNLQFSKINIRREPYIISPIIINVIAPKCGGQTKREKYTFSRLWLSDQIMEFDSMPHLSSNIPTRFPYTKLHVLFRSEKVKYNRYHVGETCH